MNMFKKVDAKGISGYINKLPSDRKQIVTNLHDLIKKTVPELKPHFAQNMIGYGSFSYVNYKKEKLQWPIIALANQKNYVSVYVCAVEDGEYVSEKYRDKLGKVNVGKSCIRFKNLEDLDLETLKKVMILASKNPGFAGVASNKE